MTDRVWRYIILTAILIVYLFVATRVMNSYGLRFEFWNYLTGFIACKIWDGIDSAMKGNK